MEIKGTSVRNFIKSVDTTLYKGTKVTKDTVLNYEREDGKLKQYLKDLEFVSEETREGDKFTSQTKTTIHLVEGDVVLFEDETRGFVVPVDKFVNIGEALEDLECIKDLDKEY